jgi:hypothetical protein
MKYVMPSSSQPEVSAPSTSSNLVYNIIINGTNLSDPRVVAKQVVGEINKQNNRREFGRRIS